MVYDYALRCAIRAWLEQTDTLVPPTPQPIKRSNSSRKLERTLSASHHYFSISNFFWDESSDKKNKFTREMVKVFSKRLEDIYKARNFEKPEYGELVFQTGCKKIRSMLKEHPYRPTATMKDVLDLFFKTCQESLKNDDNTKSQVDDYLRRYISQFSALVTETIENDAPSFGNPEMMEMLRQFTSCSPVQLKSLSSKSDTLTVNSSVPPVKEVPEELKNFPMVKTLQRLFQIDEAEHHQKLSDLMQICTESVNIYQSFFFFPRYPSLFFFFSLSHNTGSSKTRIQLVTHPPKKTLTLPCFNHHLFLGLFIRFKKMH